MFASRGRRTLGCDPRHRAREGGEAMTRPYEASAPPATAPAHRAAERDADRGVGWMVFAAVMLAMGGLLNGIYGIAAIASSKFYAGGVTYVIGDLKTLGWITLAIGAAQLAASLGILAFVGWVRWVGAAAAGLSAIVHLLIMPGAPFLGLALFGADRLGVHAPLAHGREWRDAGRNVA